MTRLAGQDYPGNGVGADGVAASGSALYFPGDLVRVGQRLYFMEELYDATKTFGSNKAGAIRYIDLSSGLLGTLCSINPWQAGDSGKGIAADAGGNIYFTSGNFIHRVDAATGVVTTRCPTKAGAPLQIYDLRFDAAGLLYLATDNDLLKLP